MKRTLRSVHVGPMAASLVLFCVCASARAADMLPEPIKAGVANWKFDTLDDGVVYLNAERAVQAILGKDFKPPLIASVVEALAECLPEGAALHLGALGGDL